MPHRTLMSDGTVQEGFAERDVIDALHLPTGNKEPLVLSGSSAAASPVRTSPPQVDGQDSPASDRPSSSTSPESPQLFSAPEVGSSLRTYPDSFPQAVDEISPSYSRRWASSGFTTSPGECWIADTSECPSVGAVSSSLPDVLVADHAPRFFLSPKAAAGIIRPAAKRGRALPRPLATALAALASLHRDDDKRTTKTSSTPSTPTGGGVDDNVAQAGHIVGALTQRDGKGPNSDCDNGQIVANPLTAEGHDASEDGTGRQTFVAAQTDPDRARAPSGLPGRLDDPVWPIASPFDPTPDSPRERQMGNAVTVGVAEWIGRRIVAHEEGCLK